MKKIVLILVALASVCEAVASQEDYQKAWKKPFRQAELPRLVEGTQARFKKEQKQRSRQDEITSEDTGTIILQKPTSAFVTSLVAAFLPVTPEKPVAKKTDFDCLKEALFVERDFKKAQEILNQLSIEDADALVNQDEQELLHHACSQLVVDKAVVQFLLGNGIDVASMERCQRDYKNTDGGLNCRFWKVSPVHREPSKERLLMYAELHNAAVPFNAHLQELGMSWSKIVCRPITK